jgi:hypothetical protein
MAASWDVAMRSGNQAKDLDNPSVPHPVVVYELVHAPGPQRGPDGVHHRHTGIDVADQLRLALAAVRALLQKDDLGLHAQPRHAHHLCEAWCAAHATSVATGSNAGWLGAPGGAALLTSFACQRATSHDGARANGGDGSGRGRH